MATAEAVDLSVLYELDETAWLETMSALAADRRYAEMDYPHLSEYLADMAKRDRREVFSRLVVLLSHLLKWEYQATQQSGSWRATIREQKRELRQMLESGTLRNHAESILADAYAEARRQAADETELLVDVFPIDDARSLDEVLAEPAN
jgi:cell division protein ZapA (FtsZ GTPase activity inhibitor)